MSLIEVYMFNLIFQFQKFTLFIVFVIVTFFSELYFLYISYSLQVNGNWGSWTEWSACSTTCGSGTMTRHRHCTDPAPSKGGEDCSGLSTDTIPCHVPKRCKGMLFLITTSS